MKLEVRKIYVALNYTSPGDRLNGYRSCGTVNGNSLEKLSYLHPDEYFGEK
jgi:hypothetical protein